VSRYFTEDQMADTGGYGCLARWMTYFLVATFVVVGLIIGLLGIGWIFNGPISAGDYDQAPVCTGSPGDSCRYIAAGTITHADQQTSNTEFSVDVNGKEYSNFYTNDARPELSGGEPVTVEIWRQDVVAITPPDGTRITTTLEPHVQTSNYVLPIVAVVMVPFFGWFVWSRLSTLRRARRRLHAAHKHPPTLPTEVTEFARSLRAGATSNGSHWDVTVTPVRAMARPVVRTTGAWIALVVLALPLVLVTLTGGHPPSSGRAAGWYWSSVVVLPSLVVFILGAFLYRRMFLANVKLSTSSGMLSVTEWNRSAHQWPVGEVAGVAVLTLTKPAQPRNFRRVYFLDRDAGVLEQINGDMFRVADIENLASSMGARVFKNEDEAYDERLVSTLFRKARR
jgi:hypothetical protein